MLAGFIIMVGLAAAGAGTHLYQWVRKQDAVLRFDGRSFVGTLGHLAMSFFCGPYIMLQMGWRQEQGGAIALVPALLSAAIAFGWSFITGLLLVGTYVSLAS